MMTQILTRSIISHELYLRQSLSENCQKFYACVENKVPGLQDYLATSRSSSTSSKESSFDGKELNGLDVRGCDVQDTLVVIIVPQIFICLYPPYLN